MKLPGHRAPAGLDPRLPERGLPPKAAAVKKNKAPARDYYRKLPDHPPMRPVTREDWWELLKASSYDTLDQHPKRRVVTRLLFDMYVGATRFAPQVNLRMWRCAAVAAELQKRRRRLRPGPAVEAAVAALFPQRVRDREFKAAVSKSRQKANRGQLPKGVSLGFLASPEDIKAALEKLPPLHLSNR
jgi:hypothetical protein